MKFKDLSIGQRFAFPQREVGYRSFFLTCVKTGSRTYKDSEGQTHRVGSINAKVNPLPKANPSRVLRSLSKRRYGEVHRVYTASDKRRQYRKSRAPYSKIFTALRRIPLASKRRKKLVSKMRKRKGLKFSYFHKTYGN